jgi:hypothetical protein
MSDISESSTRPHSFSDASTSSFSRRHSIVTNEDEDGEYASGEEHPELGRVLLDLRLRMLKSVYAMLFRILNRSIYGYDSQIRNIMAVVDYYRATGEDRTGVLHPCSEDDNSSLDELRHVCQHPWIFDSFSRPIAVDCFHYKNRDQKDAYGSIPDSLYDLKKDITEGIDTQLFLGNDYSVQFKEYLKKQIDDAKASFGRWFSRWAELYTTLRKEKLSMDDLDTPYLAARMNGLLKRFLDNFYEVMEILLENTLPENRLFPTKKDTIGSEEAEYVTSPSNAEEYDEKREAMEVQCIKKFLRNIDHDGVRAELNDIVWERK